MNNPIDFVITWVDGNDPQWLEKKDIALGNVNKSMVDARKRRFRDWNNLVYLFRGISQYASWVNHIYLVTPNQCPPWLNQKNSKVTVISQDDLFNDKSILPTFNNCAVELLFHKIPGLSEKFVYLNDDMFILKKVTENDFFRNGLPCITIAFSPTMADFNEDGKGVYGIDVMNTRIVGKHFKKKDIIKKNWRKYFDLRNGTEIIKTLLCLPFHDLVGFNEMHTAYSYLKETYREVWETEGYELEESCKVKFRGEFSINHHVMRYWQMAKGNIAVRRVDFSKMCDIYKSGDEKTAIRCIENGRPSMICINDNVSSDEEFENIVRKLNIAFEHRFPNKCEFEK